jgi:hypothetical protein
VPIVLKSGSLNLLAPRGPDKGCNGTALSYWFQDYFTKNFKLCGCVWFIFRYRQRLTLFRVGANIMSERRTGNDSYGSGSGLNQGLRKITKNLRSRFKPGTFQIQVHSITAVTMRERPFSHAVTNSPSNLHGTVSISRTTRSKRHETIRSVH